MKTCPWCKATLPASELTKSEHLSATWYCKDTRACQARRKAQ